MILLATLLCCILLPAPAWAWGPSMHLELALHCLDHLPQVAPAIAALLAQHPNEFIYGAVSPDIFLSKQRAGILFHCHNWRMGHLLLTEAATDRQRASVYGYLVHLAADVVAHNYFVPYKIIRSYTSVLATHPYWELRFDLTVPARAWRIIPQVVRGRYQEFDALLERVLKKTLFSFKTSKRIFQSILVVHKMQQLQKGLRLYARRSRHQLPPERVQHFRQLAYRTVDEFLHAPTQAPCLQGDPTGLARESGAKVLARRMRLARTRRLLSHAQAESLIALCDQRLYEAMFRPTMEWPDMYDVS